MLGLDIDLELFKKRMNEISTHLKIEPRKVMAYEVGMLIDQLIKISPPTNRQKSEKAVKNKIAKRFDMFHKEYNNPRFRSKKRDFNYYTATPEYLYAYGAPNDLRKESIQKLRERMRQSDVSGKRGASVEYMPFKHPRRRQKLRLSRGHIISKRQQSRLFRSIKDSFGRIKAGWWVNTRALDRSLFDAKTGYPMWIQRHWPTAKGRGINGLKSANPFFILTNQSGGVTGRQSKRLIDVAMKIRAASMKKNLQLIMSGVKDKYAGRDVTYHH